MVAKSLLVIISLRVLLPLAVILAIVFGVTDSGFKQVYGIGLFESIRIEKNVKPVIEEFMEAGAARNLDKFAGYKHLSINSISCKSGWTIIPPVPSTGDGESGSIDRCHVSGDITYTSTTGYKVFGKVSYKVLRFEASMVKQHGVWKIRDIRIG